VAVKRADLSKLDLSDLHREVEILRRCSHPHLLPLLGYCLDASAACLVFPLMVGGSLQTRLDLTPSDCEYLRRMGHFTAAPKPLTWRQKLRAIVQAVGALLWMHTPSESKGCTWHRDFKPANILLDDQLNAFLGDTGFAKAAQKSGERIGATTSVWGGAGSQGYCEDALRTPDAQTEAYSVGVTLLVVLTGHAPVDIEQQCCEACEDISEEIGFADIPAERLAQPNAGWPVAVAGKIKQFYVQLTRRDRRDRRLALAKLLQPLRALLEAGGLQTPTESTGSLRNTTAGVAPTAPSLQPPPPGPTPLSKQVRGMRKGGTHERLQRNVSNGFDAAMRRLEDVFAASKGGAPAGFEALINYWHFACGLSGAARRDLHLLRVWRNASDHHDAGEWQRKGPRSAEEASTVLERVERAADALQG